MMPTKDYSHKITVVGEWSGVFHNWIRFVLIKIKGEVFLLVYLTHSSNAQPDRYYVEIFIGAFIYRCKRLVA